jgi:hypothetical protein
LKVLPGEGITVLVTSAVGIMAGRNGIVIFIAVMEDIMAISTIGMDPAAEKP